jgi:hypothetical protein|tara:strand:- start:262 stop:405 length:144 start_codon:yes stop_codon:yes gene_type:complete
MRLLKESRGGRYSKRIKKGVKKGISFNYDRPKTHNRRSVRKVFRIKR